jgi:hypothetical protein
MEAEPPEKISSAVEYAAYVIARQKGAVQRIRRRHYRSPNGLCAGCVATPTEHPCQITRIADLAQRRPEYRDPL